MIHDNFTLSLDNFEERPITLLTSMFSHRDLSHLFFNMFSLYTIGSGLALTIGSSAFFSLYMISGIVSGLGFLGLQRYYTEKSKVKNPFSNIFTLQSFNRPQQVHALGASGAINGVLAAFACLYPRATFLIFGIVPVPAWLCVGGFIAYDAYHEYKRSNTGIGHSAHLFGAGVGILYYMLRLRGRY
eukprot:gene3851-4798_t